MVSSSFGRSIDRRPISLDSWPAGTANSRSRVSESVIAIDAAKLHSSKPFHRCKTLEIISDLSSSSELSLPVSAETATPEPEN